MNELIAFACGLGFVLFVAGLANAVRFINDVEEEQTIKFEKDKKKDPSETQVFQVTYECKLLDIN